MKKDALNIEVTNRESFKEFVELLLIDYKENNDNWENNRLDSFLEAMHAFAGDLDGYYKNNQPAYDSEKPSWRTFADIIRGSVVYE